MARRTDYIILFYIRDNVLTLLLVHKGNYNVTSWKFRECFCPNSFISFFFFPYTGFFFLNFFTEYIEEKYGTMFLSEIHTVQKKISTSKYH